MTGSIFWRDGFDHYNNVTDIQTLYYATSLSITAGRIDGKAFQFSTNGTTTGLGFNFASQSDLTVVFAVNPTSNNIGNMQYFLNLYDSTTSTSVFSFGINSSLNTAYFKVGSNTYSGIIPILPINNWTHIQVRFVMNSSTGSITLVLNGSNTVYTLTGINTEVGLSTSINQINYMISAFGYYTVDDFILATGGFVGDCRVQTDFPVSNNSVQFTPLANTNWQEVSEIAMDGDTSYNSTSTVGNQDTFAFTPLSIPTGSTILDVSLVSACAKTDAGTRGFQHVVLSGASNAYGAAFGPSTSYEYQVDDFAVDPSTGAAWTQTGVNAAFFGYLCEA